MSVKKLTSESIHTVRVMIFIPAKITPLGKRSQSYAVDYLKRGRLLLTRATNAPDTIMVSCFVGIDQILVGQIIAMFHDVIDLTVCFYIKQVMHHLFRSVYQIPFTIHVTTVGN